MPNWAKQIAKWTWDNLSTVITFVAWLMSFVIPAWAASTIAVLKVFEPLSIILAGFLGLAILGLGYMCVGVGSYWLTTARIRAVWARTHDSVNPLEPLFVNKRIAVVDLVTPFARIVENKTFIDCEFIGPANVYITAAGGGGSISFNGNVFQPSETVLVRDGVNLPNVINFHNCAFTRCKFFGVTLFFNELAYTVANRLIGGLHWVTATPDRPLAPIGPRPVEDAPRIGDVMDGMHKQGQ